MGTTIRLKAHPAPGSLGSKPTDTLLVSVFAGPTDQTLQNAGQLWLRRSEWEQLAESLMGNHPNTLRVECEGFLKR